MAAARVQTDALNDNSQATDDTQFGNTSMERPSALYLPREARLR